MDEQQPEPLPQEHGGLDPPRRRPPSAVGTGGLPPRTPRPRPGGFGSLPLGVPGWKLVLGALVLVLPLGIAVVLLTTFPFVFGASILAALPGGVWAWRLVNASASERRVSFALWLALAAAIAVGAGASLLVPSVLPSTAEEQGGWGRALWGALLGLHAVATLLSAAGLRALLAISGWRGGSDIRIAPLHKR